MTALEDIRNGAVLDGVAPDQAAAVISTDWIGDLAIYVIYGVPGGSVAETTLYRGDDHSLKIVTRERVWSFDADGALLQLVTEANRIKLAHNFDPYLAIHTSLVDLLPHQISAVYEEMLPRQLLRYLLANVPGAGKTIMAGASVEDCFACEPRYFPGALDTREPPFEHNAIQFSIKSLLARAEVPN